MWGLRLVQEDFKWTRVVRQGPRVLGEGAVARSLGVGPMKLGGNLLRSRGLESDWEPGPGLQLAAIRALSMFFPLSGGGT